MIGDEAADGKAPGAHFVDSRSVRQEAERDGEGGLGMSAKKTDTAAVTISAEEQKEIDRANESGTAPVALKNPANRHRAVPLTFEQFRYGFANAVPEDEAKELYATYSVAGPGEPLFQAAAANLNPWSEDKVDTKNPERGPMLIVVGEKDHTVPWAIANSSYKRERHNKDVTEIEKIDGRGHSLTIDHGWKEVAEKALAFVKRFV